MFFKKIIMGKELRFKVKDIESLKKLSTERLLSYYKARRKEKFKFYSSHCCECCGELTWELKPDSSYSIRAKKTYEDMEIHLARVKDMLRNREHIL